MNKLLRLATGKSEPPTRSPERVALAAAIEKRGAAVRECEALQQALRETNARIRDDDDGATAAIEKAKEAVESAKSNVVSYLIEGALGKTGNEPISIRQACISLQTAEDHLKALEEVRTALTACAEAAERERARAQKQVERAIFEIVRSDPGVLKLVTDFEVHRRQLVERQRVLSWIISWLHTKMITPKELPEEFERTQYVRTDNDIPNRDILAEDWKDALDRLAIDADAPLPEVK